MPQTDTRRRSARFLISLARVVAAVFAVAAAYLPVPARAYPPHNVIQSGTPLTLGQYCTAVLGSTSNPACLAKEQGDTGEFKQECESVPNMFYQAGSGLYSPQDRCLVGSGGGGGSGSRTISVSAGGCGGTVSGGGTFNAGTTRTVTAVNSPGCLFSSWVENNVVQTFESTYTFTLNSNRTLVAMFGSGNMNYSVSVSGFPSGSGTLSGGGSYPSGSNATVNATAGSCYIFSSWTENSTVVNWASNFTFPVVKNRNLVALFGSLAKFPSDLNGNGTSDIVWKQNAGPVAAWLMNGGSLAQVVGIGSAVGAWQIVGIGDFNGDGGGAKSDILWRESTGGSLVIWLMNGGTINQVIDLGRVTTDWTIAGVGDFNFDNRTDILWRHSSGALFVWLIDASGLLSPTPVLDTGSLGAVPNGWKVAGLGDFNGDGRFDILWRQDSGPVALWLMNGTTIDQVISVGAVSTDWKIAGIADFDGDCKADVLWRQDAGSVALWLMNGAAVKSVVGVASISPDWQIVAEGDYNGDRKADLLWRHNSGAVVMWLMNVGAITSTLSYGAVGTDWAVSR